MTLHPKERISIHHAYELTVDGTAPHGLTNTLGQLLDGADAGRPDSDYRTSLTWRNLVLDPPPPGMSRWPKRTKGHVSLKSAATHAVRQETGLFARSFGFPGVSMASQDSSIGGTQIGYGNMYINDGPMVRPSRSTWAVRRLARLRTASRRRRRGTDRPRSRRCGPGAESGQL